MRRKGEGIEIARQVRAEGFFQYCCGVIYSPVQEVADTGLDPGLLPDRPLLIAGTHEIEAFYVLFLSSD